MNRPELYRRSVDTLYKAFFDNTLVHGNCYACAVGNLVATGLNFHFIHVPHKRFKLAWADSKGNTLLYPGISGWGNVFCTNSVGGFLNQIINSGKYHGEAKRQIDATGYKWQELAQIEFAFESVSLKEKDRMFKGLEAVLDVLAKIHEVDDNQEDKQPFYTHHQSLLEAAHG